MTGSKDLPPSATSFGHVFFNNQFRAKPQWPSPNTDLSGRTAIVTGGNTGLGYEAAIQLLGLKLSHLIMAVRSVEKGGVAATSLGQLYPKAKIEVWNLDMSSYESIQKFTSRVNGELGRVDMVLLNAGVLPLAFDSVKGTGHLETVQVNYLSTMLLTVLLLPILKSKRAPNGGPGHITIVNAALSLAAKLPNKAAVPLLPSFDEPRTFDAQEHYNSSKLFAHMFLWNLVDYVSAEDVIINLADPAWCKGTELVRTSNVAIKAGTKVFGALAGRSKQVGASCLVDGLVNKGKESHGCFLMSWDIHPFASFLYTAEGKIVTERLWEETLVELEFAGVRGILESVRTGRPT
ncbi:NAD(P)-binding protein [Lophiostoma macrostomum CBS 122681]|uniref:NAD(P)-binding protein n=1 Tax=Lophiostoma macrostomum CBS 122681 TaxID=1314788 RepID=A0A6A6SRH3_9PLEO|nr:NAD(P)-binding protein [Lophiostoma macrostomum CBS 122681]